MVCDIASCTRQLISYAHKELTGTCLYDHNMYFIQLAGAALRKGRHMKIPKYSLVKDTLKAEITTGNFSVGQKFYTEAELIHKFMFHPLRLYARSVILYEKVTLSVIKDGGLLFHKHYNARMRSLSTSSIKVLQTKCLQLCMCNATQIIRFSPSLI